MQTNFEQKVIAVRKVLEGRISRREGMRVLGCSPRTMRRYLQKFLAKGAEGLKDRRHSNNRKLSIKDEREIIRVKQGRPLEVSKKDW